MEKIFHTTSVIFGVISGSLISLLGGYDKLLCAICILVVMDYVTGVIKAVYKKELSSEVGYRGLIKKVLIFVVISLACVLQETFSDIIPIREVVIVFYIANEAISIVENIGEIMPIPEKLVEVLSQLSGKKDKEN